MPEAVRWHQIKLKLCLGFQKQRITLQRTVASMVSPKSPMVQKRTTQVLALLQHPEPGIIFSMSVSVSYHLAMIAHAKTDS